MRGTKKNRVSDRSSKSIMQKFKLMEVYMWIAEPVKVIDKSVIKLVELFYDALNKGVIYCLMKSYCEALFDGSRRYFGSADIEESVEFRKMKGHYSHSSDNRCISITEKHMESGVNRNRRLLL